MTYHFFSIKYIGYNIVIMCCIVLRSDFIFSNGWAMRNKLIVEYTYNKFSSYIFFKLIEKKKFIVPIGYI